MALILKDRVKESSSSSGTGNITLGGAIPGYQTFNAAIATGSTVYYTIHNLTAGFDTEWEVGLGTFTSPATLARTTVLSSSNSGSAVNFTAGASGLEVFITQPAEEAVYLNNATGKVEIGGNGTNTIAFTNINASNVVMVSGTISTNAANATDITNKTYVDGLFSTGISYHDPVLVEEDVALVAVYSQPNGAGNGVGATLTNSGSNVALVVDGVSVSNTARILVYAQSNAVQNGVYTVTNPGNASAQWVLTRATDADTFGLASPNTLGQGDAFFVTDGDTGAGRTYICNTTGTITFGSTNITFAEISSSQIYAAGTGLNLANLTFSISNTAVTAGTYDGGGNTIAITVNAQGQITNVANASINASSITVGTLSNARTTASASNGANTIVLRNGSGSFGAGAITANSLTTENNLNFTGIGSRIVGDFSNATIAARVAFITNTANASTNLMVLPDGTATTSNIQFYNNVDPTNAGGLQVGALSTETTVRSLITGTGTYVPLTLYTGGSERLRVFTTGGVSIGNTTDPGNTNLSVSGNVSAGGSISGNGASLSAINASNISSGTIANARTTAASANGASTIVLRDSSGSFTANVGTFTSVSGNGVAISAINASNLTSGTIANARTTADSANGASTIVLRGASGEFAAGAITGDSFSGNGSAITAINASSISSGTVATARLGSGTANASTFLRGDQTYAAVPSPNNGTLTMNVSGTGLSGSATFTADQSGNSTFTVASNASSANGASTLVARDASGNFSAGTITATLSGTASALVTGTNYQVGGLGIGTAGAAGELRATGNVTAFYSDERLKTKTGNIENALDKVCQIETLLYHANETAVALGYDASISEVGVTAQSVQKVQPEIVVPAPIDNKYLTVRYEKLVPLLIEAIKELKAEIDALKGK
jgi:hypothetical protein